MTLRPFVTAAKIAATILLAQGFVAGAAEIKVLSAGGIRPPLEELIPQFERASGHKIAIKFVGGAAVKREIEDGAAFDVAVSTANVIDDLTKAGKLAAATRTDIAHAGVGVAVRTGAPKPDIASVDAFKRALLDAKSVAYAKDGTAGMHFHGVLQRLGISKEMEPKLRQTLAADPANSAMALVRRGEVEIGVAAVATLFAPGVDFVGPLPSELQAYIQFAAAVGTGAKEPQAGAALIQFFTRPEAGPAFKAKGMEPAPRR
jgi:molybdate transport system substrate-binding protein